MVEGIVVEDEEVGEGGEEEVHYDAEDPGKKSS